jgi:hypothetical protein
MGPCREGEVNLNMVLAMIMMALVISSTPERLPEWPQTAGAHREQQEQVTVRAISGHGGQEGWRGHGHGHGQAAIQYAH